MSFICSFPFLAQFRKEVQNTFGVECIFIVCQSICIYDEA